MGKKYKIENTLGMFDLLKGIAMILIVFAHNRSVFPSLVFNRLTTVDTVDSVQIMSFGYDIPFWGRLAFCVLASFIVAMMPVLLIISGYGFRKRIPSKFFKMNSRDLLKPYGITMIATVILNICIHYAFFRYLPGALKESIKVFGGMLLGFSQTTSIGKITLFANGPIWYVLALFWALCIFNVILNNTNEKQLPCIVMIVSAIGWLLSFIKYTPFCLSQGMIGVIYIYIGYILKKIKFFIREHSLKEKLVLLFAVIIPNIVLCYFGMVTEMADNVYSLGPITYMENGLYGIFVIYIFLRMNFLKGKISSVIRTIGRYSLYVMCIHTIEMVAVPWYVVAEHFEANPITGFIVIYIFRLILIFSICFLFIKITGFIKERMMKWKTQKSLSQGQ